MASSSTIVSKKMIKLFSPTPPSVRCHKLSFMDHINIPLHSPFAFFYPKPQNYSNKISQISQILENSLSKVLSFYYSLAGKIKDNNTYVNCDDTGAEYLNVRINCPMSEILNHPYNDVVDVVFPQDLPWSSTLNRSPLVVQLSHFDCGGNSSHSAKFINDWATTARHVDFKPSPQFNASTFFPLMSDANNFIFMDEPSGDGINVLITLTKDDMLNFQKKKELLEFASPVVESTK
ncbi:hypothetical protein R3W88_030085 [Solanum pinnatisectum]|uniref:Uncharacterized protein n=1 Tax=Solanum pinnatisectum TaxID=50273 RepID=A0AAV9K9G3_9SOLN|nr:hypothetical protein R3W88_030085 [Solanum pinnatisectum]